MLTEQVCHTEYLALEQALAAAEHGTIKSSSNHIKDRELADQLVPAAWTLHKPPVGISGVESLSYSSTAGAGSKRRLPSSFTQTNGPAAAVPTQALSYQGPITYAYTALEVDYHCTQILSRGAQAVGFDIEWRVTYKAGEVPRNTALLQLCQRDQGGSYRCWLLHIAHSGITPSLLQLLQSETVKKIGVGISGDAHKLQRDFGVQCRGLVCLSEEANIRLCGGGNGRLAQRWSLAGLCEELLHVGLDKCNDIRCSNWEQCPLSAAQQAYAATDAYAALKLYQVLQGMPVLDPPPTLEPALAPALGHALEGAIPILHMPAAAELLPLQPSKLNAYKLFTEQGLTVEGIASQRGVQLGTIQSYIAEAMAAGYPYPWHRLGVPHALLTTFCSQLTAFSKHKQQQDEIWLQHQQQQIQADPQAKPEQEIKLDVVPAQAQQQSEAQSGLKQLQPRIQTYNANSQHAGCAVQQEGQAHGHIVCHKLQQQMPQHRLHIDVQHLGDVTQGAEQQSGTGVLPDALQESAELASLQQQCAPQLWLQLNGTVTHQASQGQAGLQGVGMVGQHAVKLPDQSLVNDLVKTGQGVKALRDYIGCDVMAYGQMRIALAHLYRLSS